jgi:hypothetical protein
MLDIPDDLLPGFKAAQKRMFGTMPDSWGLIGD